VKVPSGYEQSPDYGGPEPTWRGILLAVLVVAIIVVALVFAFRASAGEFAGTADKVVDGDTFWLCDAAACRKIRLCGINAPERGEAGYARASTALADIVSGKSVRCLQVGNGTPCDGRSKPINRDRIVAQCFAGRADIGAAMVAMGFACDWVKFSGGAYSQGGNRSVCP
jgi:endonuclease YncB( thermonuclease family)